MSASTEKKRRQAAREAGTDKKTLAREKEAQEKAKQKKRWTIGTVLVVLLIAAILLLNSGLLFSLTAITVGDEDYSAAQVNYYYSQQYYTLVNQYGSYASLIGLDTSTGIRGLDRQESLYSADGGTWKDYFLQNAQAQLLQEKALRDYAAQEGIELSQEELDELSSYYETLEQTATLQGYAGGDNFLAANYGTGVDLDLVMEADRNSTLASKALTAYSDSLEYSQQELEEQYESYEGEQDYFRYAYYYVSADQVETTGEDGETTSQVTDETRAQAQATAQAIYDAYEDSEGEDYVERLDQAVASQVEDGSATESSPTQGSYLSTYKDWMMESGRQAGDATMVADSSENGYYVVVFLSRDDNDYNVAQVRHILVMAQADENGEYTDEAKAQALERAQEILDEYLAGEQTEESFAALAEQYSEDSGSNTNGGLYDNVIHGQMVDEFDRFCFEDHQPGDTAIVYGESSSYAGYHVMYYVGEGENYALQIARTDLANTAVSEWIDEICSAYEVSTGLGLGLVGK